ncbi:MAG: hypothetical protein P1V20_30160, partial [Verrucomicrobiales bacterium]|nr:hypothetical protein [Verrucomicrobiales bacterium]
SYGTQSWTAREKVLNSYKKSYEIPNETGVIVDMNMAERMQSNKRLKIVALAPDGKVRISYTDAQPQADHILDAVQVAGDDQVGIALIADGTCRVFSLYDYAFGSAGWQGDLNEAASWKNIVSVNAGDRHVLGLTADGNPHGAGFSGGDRNACSFPAEYHGRTFRIHALAGVSRLNAISSNGSQIEVFDPRSNKVVRQIPGTNRIFGWLPREADKDGDSLKMHFPARQANLPGGSEPSDVTYARSIGAKIAGENVWIAAIREGINEWRFWGDLGNICKIDEYYCRKRAQNCRKVFLNPPYMIALKPVAAITDEDWTGETIEVTGASPEQVPTDPRYRNALPLQPLERPRVWGSLEVFRRDGKPLDKSHPEIAILPENTGNEIVDLQVFSNPNFYSGIILNADGTVKAWSNKANHVDLSQLEDIVAVRAGNDKLMALDSSGIVTMWTRNGIQQGRFNEREEPVRRIALGYADPFVLTESGKVSPVYSGTGNWMATGLPPSIDIAACNVPYVLGIDGKWRSWNQQSNRRVAAKFDSGYPLSPPLVLGWHLWWIDGDNMLRQTNQMGVKQVVNPFEGKKIAMVTGGRLIFIKNVLDRWSILGGPNNQREHIESKIQKSISATASMHHIFCLKPWGE